MAFVRDLLHAVRSLAKARSFTFVCVASLGIGMGTVIGIVMLIRTFGPPAGFEPKGLVELLVKPQGRLFAQTGSEFIETWSYPDFSELRAANSGLTITGWAQDESVFQPLKGSPAPIPTMYVSANYFATMDVALERGPGFDPRTDEDAAAQPAVVISHDFWNDRLSSDPDVLGKTITLNRIPHVVVGIIPDGFHHHLNTESFPRADLWVPLLQHPRVVADASVRFDRDTDWVRIHGRPSAGVSIEQANAAVSGIMSGLAERYPASNEFKAASVEPYLAMGALRRPVFNRVRVMFLSMAAVVLMVICLNISGMVLVRSAMRERELSIRQAVGAARGQLIRYLLSEAIVLATLAGSLASALLLGFPAVLSWRMGEPIPPALKPDAPMIAICVGLCAITSLLFGLAPAIRFSRPALISALKDDAGGGGRQVGRAHRLTAAIQVGLAVPFLIIGGVLLDHVRTSTRIDLGFQPKGLVAAPVNLAGVADTPERAASLLQNARENLSQTSGVASVTVADGLPLDFTYRLRRVSREQDEATAFRAHMTRVAQGYLNTMGVQLLRGRGITAEDRAGAALVAVINQPVAARLFPNGDAVGERITVTFEDRSMKVVTIVGVTAHFVSNQMSNPPEQILLPLAQHPVSKVFLIARGVDGSGSMSLVPAFRNAIRELNPDFDATSLITGERLVRRSTQDMFTQFAFAGFGGGVALTLAALGVYGVIGFMVAVRTREIAVRIAIGASQWQVVRKVVIDVVQVVAPGVALGLIAGIVIVRNSYLSWYALGAVEHLVYAAAVTIAVSIAIFAGLPAARRAAKVQPMVAMRSE